MALAPVLPIIILFLGATVLPIFKMSIAEAMIYGVIFTFLVSRADPQQVTKEFFNGMGNLQVVKRSLKAQKRSRHFS